MRTQEHAYLDLLRDVRDNGESKDDRTGTGTRSVFGRQIRFDLSSGEFPALTTKRLYFDTCKRELLWFLSGDRNLEALARQNVHIWDSWPYRHYVEATEGRQVSPEETSTPEWRSGMKAFIGRIATDHAFAEQWGDLGPVYGYQWRHWLDGKGGEIDQIQRAVDTIKTRLAGATL